MTQIQPTAVLPDEMQQTARTRVRKNSTTPDVGVRRRLNFIEGANVAATITDDPVNEEVDITLAVASAPPSGAAGGDLSGTFPNPTLSQTSTSWADLTAVPTVLATSMTIPANYALLIPSRRFEVAAGVRIEIAAGSFLGVSMDDENRGPAWNHPWGRVGYADNTGSADQTVTATTADITGLSATFLAAKGRRYRWLLSLFLGCSAAAQNSPIIDITDANNNVLAERSVLFTNSLESTSLYMMYEETAPADMYLTRKARLTTTVTSISVSGNNTAGRYGVLTCDDIGPAVKV